MSLSDHPLIRNYSEMPTDREFGEDASWKRIQQNTFTRWVNEHLKSANKQIANLETDLCDGLRLIALIEVLSGKKVIKFNKRPTFRSQKLENISMTLEFLGSDEGIKIVNIDSTDIIDCNLKLILGLIWTLILHYSITIPSWDNEESVNTLTSSKKKGSEPTPKQKLLTWIQSRIPDLTTTNFTTDWNNGKALGALVDAIAPGLCPDWPDWNTDKALDNLIEAMQLAEEFLSVPQLIKPQEMVNRNVDEQSMMTYLSQFPGAKLKPNAPLRPRTNPAKVRVYGPGIESGITVGNNTNFTVETFSAGRGKVEVGVKNLDKNLNEAVDILFNNDKNVTYTCMYKPSQEGTHLVDVKFAGKSVNKSPFKIMAEEAKNDPSRVNLEGPAIQDPKLKVDEPTHFKVITKDAGKGVLECRLVEMNDDNTSPNAPKDSRLCNADLDGSVITIREIRDFVVSHTTGNNYSQNQRRSLGSIMVDGSGTSGGMDNPYYVCEFIPHKPGPHQLRVTFAGSHVPQSPLNLMIEPSIDMSKFYLTGRGVQPKGIRAGDKVRFNINYFIDSALYGWRKSKSPNNFRRSSEPPLKSSPTSFAINGTSNSPIQGIADRTLIKAQILNATNNTEEYIRKFIPSPFDANEPGTYENQNALMTFEYIPKSKALYYLNVYYGTELLPKMPIQIEVSEHKDSLIKAFGPGLMGGFINQEACFTVETNGQTGALGFAIEGPSQTKIDCKDNGDGSADVSFVPQKAGEYSVRVLCDDLDIPDSPFMATFIDPSQTYNVGEAALDSEVNDFKNVHQLLMDTNIDELKKVKVYGNGILPEKPSSPTKYGPAQVTSKLSRNVIKPGKLQTFYIDFSQCKNILKYFDNKRTLPQIKPFLTITDANLKDIKCGMNYESVDKRFRCEYLPEQLGKYIIYISVQGFNLPCSPFKILAQELVNPNNVKLDGECFKCPVKMGQLCQFAIDTSTAGKGDLSVIVKDSNQQTVNLIEPNIVNSCGRSVSPYIHDYKFLPTLPGKYLVNVLYDGLSIPTNPHMIQVERVIDISKIKIMDLEPKVLIGSAAEIIIDASLIESSSQLNSPEKGFRSPPMIHISDFDDKAEDVYENIMPKSANTDTYSSPTQILNELTSTTTCLDKRLNHLPIKCLIYYKQSNRYYEAHVERLNKSRNSGFYIAYFNPKDEGTYTLDFTYNDIPILAKPFEVIAINGCDPSKVKVAGPGLNRGYLDETCEFLIDTRRAGTGGLGLTIEGPSEAKMNCQDNRDGTCSVSYLPTKSGNYDISIKFEDIHVSGSPFMAKIYEKIDYTKIDVYGPGCDSDNFRAGIPTNFIFDASRTGSGNLEAYLVEAQSGQLCDIQPMIRKIDYLAQKPFLSPSPSPTDAIEVYEEKLNYSKLRKNVIRQNFLETCSEEILSSSDQQNKSSSLVDNMRSKSLNYYYNTNQYDTSIYNKYPGFNNTTTAVSQNRTNNVYEITYIPPSMNDKASPNNINRQKHQPQPPYPKYVLTLKYNDVDVPSFPKVFDLLPSTQPELVQVYTRCYELNIDSLTYIYASIPTELFIDTRKAGIADLDITVHDSRGRIIPGRLYPFTPILHKFYNHVEKNAPQTNYSTHLKDQTSNPDKFYLKLLTDAKNMGKFEQSFDVIEPELLKEELEKLSQEDLQKLFVYTFTPHSIGSHLVNVKFDGIPISQSPFKVYALPIGHGERAKVYDEFYKEIVPIKIIRKWEQCFKVDASECFEKEEDNTIIETVDSSASTPNLLVGKVTCLASNNITNVFNQSNSSETDIIMEECSDIVDNLDGTFSVFLNFKNQGYYQLETHYGGKPIPHGDFKFRVEDNKIYDRIDGTDEYDFEKLAVEENYLKQLTSFAEYRTVEFTLPSLPVDFMSEKEFTDAFGYYKDHKQSILRYNDNDNCVKIVTADAIERRRKRALLALTAEVKSPSGRISLPKVTSNTDGTINLKYHPSEPGLHEIDIKYQKQPVQGSPYQFFVDKIKDTGITAWGPGLSYGQSGEACNFTVVTKEGQSGGLKITVDGPSKIEVTCHDNKDSSVGVTYVPQRPGEYKVNVKYNDKNISGSPFSAKITGEGSKRVQLSSGSANEISLKIDEKDVKQLKGSVLTPAGVEDVCLLRQLPNGNIGVSFTPHEIGVHTINILKAGEHIEGSPFKIDIKKSDLGDASKVKLSGPGLKEGKTQQANSFKVDTKQSGYGGLSVSLEGPSRAEINCKDNHDGTSEFTYTVKQPGTYNLNVKFADNHVPGSPFSIKVAGKASVDVKETLKKEIKVAETTGVGKSCQLNLKLLDTDPLDLSAQVTSPNGMFEECEIVNHNEGKFSVMFTAHELGLHSISVKVKGQHIQGSPFPFTVGAITRDEGTGAHKVKAYGPGLVQAEVNVLVDFNVNTHEAGTGFLGVTIEGPGKTDIRYEDLNNGFSSIDYKCSEAGEYKVNVTFNDKAIPDSPFTVYITPPMGEARKITVTGLEDQIAAQAAVHNKPVTFTVHMNGVKGHLDARVVSPTGQEDDCSILPSGEDAYLVRFVPKVKGTHYVSVKFNHVHIRHSPFRIRVGKDIEGDPVKVKCSGKGLSKGDLNKSNEFFVNTADSGTGVLAVHIDGPGKCEVLSKEEGEGYRVSWIPTIPGNYYLTVKFGGHHVTGSPFKAIVDGKKPAGNRRESSGVVIETVTKTRSDRKAVTLPKFKSDSEKVETRGIGLQKAFMNKHNTFNVNCSKAGEGFLMVGLYNNRMFTESSDLLSKSSIINGTTHVDIDNVYNGYDKSHDVSLDISESVNIIHHKNQFYTIHYEVKNPGEYVIIVLWDGKHIPGSPFIIETIQ